VSSETNPPSSPEPIQTYRIHERYCSNLTGFVQANGQKFACRITDVSPFGAKVEFKGEAKAIGDNQTVTLRVPKVGKCTAKLCWTDPQNAGIEFLISDAEKGALEDFLMNVLAEDH